MAQLPSLALGLGLQGKPIDRAALNLRRAEGEERAALRAQQKAQKDLDPYKKRVFAVGDKAYLPVHKEMMSDKVAGVWKYLSENADNVDYQQLGNMIYDIESLSQVAQKNYNDIAKLSSNPKYAHLKEDFEALRTISNPNDINSAFQNRAGFQAKIGENGDLVYSTYENMPTETFVTQIIKDKGNTIWEEVDTGKVSTVGGQKFVTLRPTASSVESAIQEAYNNPSVIMTESNQLERELAKTGSLPDLSTDKGKAEFDQQLRDRIEAKTRTTFDINNPNKLAKERGDINIFNQLPGDKNRTMQAVSGQIPFKIDNVQFFAKSAGGIAYGDKDSTIPFTDQTFYSNGQRANVTGQKGTYNYVGASYTLDKDYTVPETIVIKNSDGKKVELKKGRVFKKGALVPSGFENFAYENGADFSPKIIAWAEDSNGQWFYTPSDLSLQAKFMVASKDNKMLIDRTQREQKELSKKLKTFNRKKDDKPAQSQPKAEPKVEVKDANYYKNKYKTSFQTK